MTRNPFLRWRWAAVAVAIAAILILIAIGRPPICTCGTIELWGASGPEQSQMLADWYSASHLVHGFLFFGALWLAAGKQISVGWRFVIALVFEATWEVIENTPMVIDRYREATVALGYTGDSILNSASDIAMMAVGFLLARRLPLWSTVAVVIALELIPLIVIRDNLTLNVLMLLAPSETIRLWQSGA